MWVMSVSGSNAARAFFWSCRSTDRNWTSRPLGSSGLRRGTPTTSQPAARNFSIAATPSRPLAPVTRTLFRPLFFPLLALMIRAPRVDEKIFRRRWLCRRCVDLEPFCDVGSGVAVEGPIKIFADVADVWCCEGVLQLPEGMIRRQRLYVEYVDGCAGVPVRLQRFDQGCL